MAAKEPEPGKGAGWKKSGSTHSYTFGPPATPAAVGPATGGSSPSPDSTSASGAATAAAHAFTPATTVASSGGSSRPTTVGSAATDATSRAAADLATKLAAATTAFEKITRATEAASAAMAKVKPDKPAGGTGTTGVPGVMAREPASVADKSLSDAKKASVSGVQDELIGLAKKTVLPITAAATLAVTAANLQKALSDLDSEFLTGREKALGFAAAIPVIGSSLSKGIASIMDAAERLSNPEQAERIERMRIEIPQEMEREQARFEFRQKKSDLEDQVKSAEIRARVTREMPTAASQLATQRLAAIGGFGGGVAGIGIGAVVTAGMDKIDPRVEAANEALRTARRESKIADQLAAESQKEVDEGRPGTAAAVQRRRDAERETRENMEAANGPSHRERGAYRAITNLNRAFGDSDAGKIGAFLATPFVALGGWAGPTRAGEKDSGKGTQQSLTEAVLNEQRASLQAAQALAEQEAKITNNKEKQLDALRKQHEISRAEVGVARANLAVLDEKLSKAKTAERQFAAMSGSDQSAVLSALKRFQQLGRENITEGELQLLMGNQATAEFVGKKLEQDGANNPFLKAIRDITKEKDAAELQKERDKLKAEVDIKIQLDEEKFSQLVAEQMRKFNIKELLGEILEERLTIMLRKPGLDFARGKVEKGG